MRRIGLASALVLALGGATRGAPAPKPPATVMVLPLRTGGPSLVVGAGARIDSVDPESGQLIGSIAPIAVPNFTWTRFLRRGRFLLAEGENGWVLAPVFHTIRGLALLDDTGRVRWTETHAVTNRASKAVYLDDQGNVAFDCIDKPALIKPDGTKTEIGAPPAGPLLHGPPDLLPLRTLTSEQVTRFGSAQDDYGQSVCVDSSGNVYLAGYTSGALPGRTSAGAQDVFLRKYDSGGAELWTRQFGSGARDIGQSVAVDGSGGVYIGGYTEGVLDPNRNPIDMISEVFVKKYDSGGAEKWIRQFGWNGTHYGQSVSVDGSGVYVVGFSNNLSPNAGVFAKKYDASGTDQWTRTFGTTSGNEAYSASVDGSGHIYIAGYTSGTLPGQSSAGLHDAFVQILKP